MDALPSGSENQREKEKLQVGRKRKVHREGQRKVLRAPVL